MDRSTFEHIYQNELTPKQREILPYLLDGLLNKEIAEKLFDDVVPSTISHRISSISKKFGACDKKDLIWLFNQFRSDLVSDLARKSAGIQQVYEINYPECSEALDSPFYLERENIDAKCQQLIDKQGCLLKIRGAKQMGKTSLINRLVDLAVTKDNYEVYYDFSFFDVDSLNNIQRFFYSLADYITEQISDLTGKQLDLSSWDKKATQSIEYTKVVKNILLKLDKPLVLIFDETDRLFHYDAVYQSFAPLLRHWHEKGKTSSVWKKLKLIIGYSTEDYGILDIRSSPFANVGQTIALTDLTEEQVFQLTSKHNIKDSQAIKSLIDLVGGHPYLIRLALYYLSQENMPIDKLMRSAATDSGIYQQHLQRHLNCLQDNSALESAFKQILDSNTPVIIKEQKIRYPLEGMGLINTKDNSATVRYQLYSQYFANRL